MQDDGLNVAEVPSVVILVHFYCQTEVSRLFIFQQGEEAGSKFRNKIVNVVLKIRERFVADERYLLLLPLHRIPMSQRLVKGHFDIRLRSSINLRHYTQDQERDPPPHHQTLSRAPQHSQC